MWPGDSSRGWGKHRADVEYSDDGIVTYNNNCVFVSEEAQDFKDIGEPFYNIIEERKWSKFLRETKLYG